MTRWEDAIVFHQYVIKKTSISPMVMKTTTNTGKTTTNTGKNQKISAEMRIESVEAIQTINLSPKNLTMIHWTSSLSQLSVL